MLTSRSSTAARHLDDTLQQLLVTVRPLSRVEPWGGGLGRRDALTSQPLAR